jgi:hypothetical protein
VLPDTLVLADTIVQWLRRQVCGVMQAQSHGSRRSALPSRVAKLQSNPLRLFPAVFASARSPYPRLSGERGSDYVAYFCGLECYDRWRNPSGGL